MGASWIFLTRPISLFLLLLAAVSITNPYWKEIGGAIRKLFGKSQPA